jgi:hypothetical protein
MSGKRLLVDDLTYIPFAAAMTPRDGQVYCDRWWIVHPEKGLTVWRGIAPQCNRNKALGDLLLKHYPGHEMRHFDVAYTGSVGL